jgi:hypothetical protein
MLYAQLGEKQKLMKGKRYELFIKSNNRPHTDGTEKFLIVGTPEGLIQINTSTYEVLPLVLYKDFQYSDTMSPRHRDNLVQMARTYAFEFSEQMVGEKQITYFIS